MASRRVYVGGLSPLVYEDDLKRFFKGFGPIREVMMKNGFCFVDFDDERDASDAAHDLNGRELKGNRVSVEIARGTPHGRDKYRDPNSRHESGRRYESSRSGFGSNRGGYGPPPRRYGYRDNGGYGPVSSNRNGGYGRGGGPLWGNSRTRAGPPSRTPYRVMISNLSGSASWQDLKDFMRQAGDVVYADIFGRRNEGVVEFASMEDMKNALNKLNGKEFRGRKVKLSEDRGGVKTELSFRRRSRDRSSSQSGNGENDREEIMKPKGRRRQSESASSPSTHSSRSSSASHSRSPRRKRDQLSDSRSRSRSPVKAFSRSRSRSPAKIKAIRNHTVSPDPINGSTDIAQQVINQEETHDSSVEDNDIEG